MAQKSTAEALTSARQVERRARARVRTLEARLTEEAREGELQAKARIADAFLAKLGDERAAKWVRAAVAAMSEADRDVVQAGLPDDVVEALFSEREKSSDAGPSAHA